MATNRALSDTRKTISYNRRGEVNNPEDGTDSGRSNYPSEDVKKDAIEDDKEEEEGAEYEYGNQPSQNFVAWLEEGAFK